MKKDIMDLCCDYLEGINMAEKLNAVCPGMYCSANNDRSRIHEQICDYFNLSHCDKRVLEITCNLDKSIGFISGTEYESDEIREFARKLYERIRSIGGVL